MMMFMIMMAKYICGYDTEGPAAGIRANSRNVGYTEHVSETKQCSL
jgi:hypothetical protein